MIMVASVLYDFHKIKQLLNIEHLHAEVIQYEQVSLCELDKEPVQGTGDAFKCNPDCSGNGTG